MRPFNLERALAGDKVVTQFGEEVILDMIDFRESRPTLCGHTNGVHLKWNLGGIHLRDTHQYNLYMVSKKVKRYVAVEKSKNCLNHTSNAFKDKVDITESAYPSARYQIIEIEVDEE